LERDSRQVEASFRRGFAIGGRWRRRRYPSNWNNCVESDLKVLRNCFWLPELISGSSCGVGKWRSR
jgi:hypothetical protein